MITGHNLPTCWKRFRQNHLVYWHIKIRRRGGVSKISTKGRALLFKNVSNIPPLRMKANSSFTLPNPTLVPALSCRCCFFTFHCLLRDFLHAKGMAEGAAEVILSNIPPSHPTFWYSDHTLAPPRLPARILTHWLRLPVVISALCPFPSLIWPSSPHCIIPSSCLVLAKSL